jgi:hypothetical protein
VTTPAKREPPRLEDGESKDLQWQVAKRLKPSGKYLSHLLDTLQVCIFIFRMILSLDSNYFLKQR